MNIKKDFPIFKKNIIYLDNAATTQKPKVVIDSIKNYFENTCANTGRGIYKIAEDATNLLEKSRGTVAKYLCANSKEIIFTRNATESINILSCSLSKFISKEKNEIVLTEMEHHSNIIPWQELAKRSNAKLIFIKIKKDLSLDYKDAKKKITKKTAIVSITHKSNLTGIKNNIQKIISIAKRNNSLSIIDCSQTAINTKIDVKKLDCDFLVFSGHKMYGPDGIGILYGKKKLLDTIRPAYYGGGMPILVTEKYTELKDAPHKFESGTQNVSGAIGLMNAINYIQKIGRNNILTNDKKLTKYALKKLKLVSGIKIYGKNQEGIISFNVEGVHPHDVAQILNDSNICIRVGTHCAMPLLNKMGTDSTCRISFTIYNTKEEIDFLIKKLNEIKNIFK